MKTSFFERPAPNFRWQAALKHRQSDRYPNLNTFYLRESKGLDGMLADVIVDSLFSQRRRRTKPIEAACRCLLANLAHAASFWGNDKCVGVIVPKGKYKPAIPSRYRSSAFSVDTLSDAIDALIAQDVVVFERGFYCVEQRIGLYSFIVPTTSFMEKLDNSENHDLVTLSKLKEPVVLKNEDKSLVDYEDDEFTCGLRNGLTTQNEFRQSSQWCFTDEERQYRLADEDLRCKRVFNGGWTFGGRLYCPAQSLPKLSRRTITIDGQKTVELDYKSLQPRIMYHVSGLDSPEDCYAVDGLSRAEAKSVALVAIGTSSRLCAKRALVSEFHITHTQAGEMLECFERAHAGIKQSFYNEAWKWLQYYDSQLCSLVVESLTMADIPVLPVHDSFVVPEIHLDTLEGIMRSSYQQLFNNAPQISVA
ncbi:hypothetical protein PY479_12165 [Shewanella sp. A32]|uniref:hypothetical protein n=1 Tax=Shewanella sp. A32 TaxID=3031327 RepID=UPI0023B8B964|nr:hypothetical protein [Shewanella sp. A32]MDF0535027.1 hypothetical protein [Shewanella sp. A32]